MENLKNREIDALSEVVRDSDYLMIYLGIGTVDFFKEINETYIYTDEQFTQLIDDLIFETNNRL